MNGQGGRRAGMGASSLLLILVVLCLTTMGVLSLSGAVADMRLGQNTADTAIAYYSASANAQRKIAEIDAELAKNRREAANSAEYEAKNTEFGLENVETDQGLLSFTEPLSDGRSLLVRLEILPYDSAERYRVETYMLIDERDWDLSQEQLAISQ